MPLATSLIVTNPNQVSLLLLIAPMCATRTLVSVPMAAPTTVSSTTRPAGSAASLPRSRRDREVMREARHLGAQASAVAIWAMQ